MIGVSMFAAYKREKLRLLRVYRMEKHKCSCRKNGCTAPGKHPAAWNNCPNNGVKNASFVWDEEDFEGYNVGVATGRGLLIVDIDPRNDGHITWNEIVGNHELPDTWTCATGGGGTHIYYRIPTDCTMRSLSFNGVDFQYENKYAVMPPSKHRSGQLYEWEDCDPDEDEIAEIPPWLLEWMQGHLKRFQSSMVPEGTTHYIKPHDYEWPWIYKILEELTPDCGYQNWIAVGMGLHATGSKNAYELWDKWSSRDKQKYVPGETAKKWASFGSIRGAGEGYTYRWLFALADMYGIEYGEETEFLKEWFETQKRHSVSEHSLLDVESIAVEAGPLLKSLYDNALTNAHIPIPEFGLASALQVLSGCVQGSYLDPTGGSLNLYQWCAAPAASGKDAYFKWVERTLKSVKENLIAPEFQSSGGFRSALLACNSRVAVRDEFHDEIMQIATTKNEFLKALLKDYKMLWNMPDALPLVVIKASFTPGVDKPIFGLMGFSTTTGLEKVADEEFLASGLGSRFLFWELKGQKEISESQRIDLDLKVLKRLKDLFGVGLTMIGKALVSDTEILTKNQTTASKGGQIKDSGPALVPEKCIGWRETEEKFKIEAESWEVIQILEKKNRPHHLSIMRRKMQHTIRLACLRCISFGREELLDDDVRWADKIVSYNIEQVVRMFSEKQRVTYADEQVMSRAQKVLEVLGDAEEPLIKSDLINKSRIAANNLNEVLLHLNAAGRVDFIDPRGNTQYNEKVLKERGIRFQLNSSE